MHIGELDSSFAQSSSQRNNIDGLNEIKFPTRESTFEDGIVDYFESETYSTKFTADQDAGNMLDHQLFSNVSTRGSTKKIKTNKFLMRKIHDFIIFRKIFRLFFKH